MTGRNRPADASSSAARDSRSRLRRAHRTATAHVHPRVASQVGGHRREAAAGHAERAEPPTGPEQAERRRSDIPADTVEHHVGRADGVADL